MEAALAEGRIAVRFFAEQDFLNGYFKVGRPLFSVYLLGQIDVCPATIPREAHLHARVGGYMCGHMPAVRAGGSVAGRPVFAGGGVPIASHLPAVAPHPPTHQTTAPTHTSPPLTAPQGLWTHLPYTYNAQKRIKYHHPKLWRLEDIRVIHYVDEKPVGVGHCTLCSVCVRLGGRAVGVSGWWCCCWDGHGWWQVPGEVGVAAAVVRGGALSSLRPEAAPLGALWVT